MITLDGQPLTLEELESVARSGTQVRLGDAARERMRASRAVIDQIVAANQTVYGVNTGFGKLSDIHIPPHRLRELQLNLVRSHACGVGDPLPPAETRAMLLLRANVLATGFSGAREEVADHLIAMLNANVLPVIPEKGSVGASGDLAPLAHLAMGAIGEGDAIFGGVRMNAKEALAKAGMQPLELEAKEGLVLLNGTQAIVAVGGLALAQAMRLCRVADLAGAMSLEALLGTPAAFDPRIHAARPHPHQIAVAQHLLALMHGSEIRESHREGDPRVQDAYALRCMPQVHGAVRQAVDHARNVLEIESGSATDNPLVFPETGEVISGGNFHGAPLANALDYAAIGMTDLASISERRIDRLVTPEMSEGLPAFLAADAGSSSGFMIPHVVAAALLNECKLLAHPASVDSVPTSGGKEDHVSMGMTSALKLRTICWNVSRVLAIELLAAAEGLEFRKPLRPGLMVNQAYERIRSIVPRVAEDRSLSEDIEALASKLDSDFLWP